MTVPLSPLPQNPTLCIIHFDNLTEALEQINALLEQKPLALEILDEKVIQAGKSSPTLKGHLEWLKGDPQALLIVEFDGHNSQDQAKQLAEQYKNRSSPVFDKTQMLHVWELRKAGLGLLMSKRSYSRAIAFLEDIAVPPHQLASFMQQFSQLLKTYNKEAGIYGHAGAGCLHIRPYMDLRQEKDKETMQALMLATTQLLLQHQGTLSGEHGDGLIRSWLNETIYGPEIYQGFVAFKQAFDPHHLMNPHKIVQGPPLFENLRTHPTQEIKTFLDFRRDGGIDLAVDMCNGNGLCRKKEGTMCPSFQATLDEYDSTRARANALRAVMAGDRAIGNLSSQNIHDILDLCLSCKGCKSECPSQVDMAKLKAEASYHYRQKHGLSLRNRAFGQIGKIFKFGSKAPQLINNLNNSRLVRWSLEQLGVTRQRPLPKLAKQTFEAWAITQTSSEKPSVILFNDTFTNYLHPEIGIAAYNLLKTLGLQVIVSPWICCGRTSLSKGMLPEAKKGALHLVNSLKKHPNLPIITLEPSCWSALVDDYRDLIGHGISQTYTLEEYLQHEDLITKLQNLFKPTTKHVAVHVHCHTKALQGSQPIMTLLNQLPGIHPQLLETGCCGMAGSFGYETEHVELSMQIGELTLFPAILSLPKDTPIIANGTSCRAQIHDGTKRTAIHLSEFLYKNLNIGVLNGF